MPEALSAAQEAEAHLLAERIGQAVEEELLQVARTLVGAGKPFGATEFRVREIMRRATAKAFEVHLAQKKTATRGPA